MSKLQEWKKKLTKEGKIILIVSLSLALIFFIIGFSKCDAVSGHEPITVSLNDEKTVDTVYGETYQIEFVVQSSGHYKFSIDNGELIQVKEKEGYSTKTFYSASSAYEYAYYIYDLQAGTTYTLTVEAEDSYISFFMQEV